MQNFKSFFIIVSHSISGGNYGKSTSLKEALKLSKVNTKSKYVTYVGLVKEDASDEQLKNICSCFCVDDYGNVRMYNNPSAEDNKMVDELFIGWSTNINH